MKVQVITVLCCIFLQKTYGAVIADKAEKHSVMKEDAAHIGDDILPTVLDPKPDIATTTTSISSCKSCGNVYFTDLTDSNASNDRSNSNSNTPVIPDVPVAIATDSNASSDTSNSNSNASANMPVTQNVPVATATDSNASSDISNSNSNANANMPVTPNVPIATATGSNANVETTTARLFVSDINSLSGAVTAKPNIEVTSSVDVQSSTTTGKPKIDIPKSTTPVVHNPIVESEEPLNLYDPKADAKKLHHCQEGSTVDVNCVINILTHRTSSQRMDIAVQYKHIFKAHLVEDLRYKLNGWLKEFMVALLTPPIEYYAKELFEAMHGAGTDEDALIEILCTLSNEEIKKIREVYETTYGDTLETHIKYDTSGYFEDLLLALIKANRDEIETVSKTHAQADAKELLQAGEQKLGTDETKFIEILTKRNLKQVEQIMDEYKILTEHTLEYAIECEFSSFIKRGLLAILKVAENLPNFFAERLHASMDGSGTYNKHLIRIITTRNEIDIELIKIYYIANYDITLRDAVKDDTSGDYENALLSLIGDL